MIPAIYHAENTAAEPESASGAGTKLLLIAAVLVGLTLRLALYYAEIRGPDSGLERGYIETAATIASGFGPLMAPAESVPLDVVKYAKEREAVGGRVDAEHPYPPDSKTWLPATIHPAGYSWLFVGVYRFANYTWTVRLLHFIQAGTDAITCLVIYLFLSHLFGLREGLAGAWLYSLLPSSMVLTLRLLPDSFSCFFAAAILALSVRISTTRLRYAFFAGAVIGIASQFRAEFFLWSFIIMCAVIISAYSVASKLRAVAIVVAAEFILLMPWIVWSHRATGYWLPSASDVGGTMYQALGEDPHNPWDITLQDEWIEADAVRHGFASAWTPAADAHYRSVAYHAIISHPSAFVRLILIHRLPVALVPPFSSGSAEPGDFSLWDLRRKLGLTRWGVLARYPGLVVRNMWRQILVGVLSFFMTVCLFTFAVVYRTNWRDATWIILPWVCTVFSITILKQVEPRNMAAIIVPGVSAAAVLLSRHSGSASSFRPA